MTNNAELMCNTRPSPPNRFRTIIRSDGDGDGDSDGDGSTKKIEFIGKIDPLFYSKLIFG